MDKQFFKKMVALPMTRDRWNTYIRNNKIRIYGNYLGYAIVWNNSTINNHIKDVLPLAENNYWSLMGMTSSLLMVKKSEKVLLIAEKYLEKAKRIADNQRSKADIANELYIEGLIAKKRGNSRKARNLFRKSIKINSKKNNPSYKDLKEL